jgi:hypothetical protein
MTRRRFAPTMLLLGVAAAQAGLPSFAHGYSTGPPNGHAGDPPNHATCVECHSSFQLNSGNGDLRLLNAPATVTPGQTYDLMVELLDPGQHRWGFELTVLDDSDHFAGQITVTDPARTQVHHDAISNRDYLKHTFTGTDGNTAGPTQWPFQWTAPLTFGAITFYFAGNAADNSGFQFGDFIYARAVTLMKASPVEPTTWGQIKRLLKE